MRTIQYLGSSLLVLLIAAACKKDNLKHYDTEDNIYFTYRNINNLLSDSANFSFGFSPLSVQDSMFSIPVLVTGAPSGRDRKYKVVADADGTTAIEGVNYVLPEPAIFPAGKVIDTLKIKLFRAANLQGTIKKLKIRLEATEDLKTDITSVEDYIVGEFNVQSFRINISDEISAGIYWAGSFARYFGTFSVKKLRLINELTGMPLDYHTTGWLTDLNMSARAASWAIFMSRYLADQKAAGNTILDEDGSEMLMGEAYR